MDRMKMQKLSDDSLDMVTGGTNREMSEIGRELGANNLKDIKDGLNKKGLKAKLSTKEDNEYTDLKGNILTHDEVLARLRNS